MRYALLPRKEWHRLVPIFDEQLKTQIPEWSNISVAQDDGRIVGLQVLQPQFHAEPLWIDREYRGRVSFVSLQQPLKDILPSGVPYYILSKTDLVDGMAEFSGLVKLPHTVWKGHI